jgi:2-oxoglutarate dehydrogenase E2 component (dihydrolipoamide succinyltransferase)
MTTIELKVPAAGESITEVVVVEWLKSEGSIANQDEALALIETDKANVEVVAPARGRIARILKRAGETARVGEVIGLLEEEGAQPSAEKPRVVGPPTGDVLAASAGAGATPERGTREAAPAPKPAPRAETRRGGDGASRPARMTPAARRAMRESQSTGEPAPSPPPPPRVEIARPPDQANGRIADRRDEVVAMTPLRKRVAERLLEAQETAALLTTFNEIDMSSVMALRKQHQDAFVQKHGIKLGFMSFFVKAAVEALRAYPAVNAEIRGTDIVYHHYYDIGVAVGGGRGLVVPIIRSAEKLGFAEIEKTIADFAARAKDSKLKVEELQGGTFTISNGGIYGSLMSTPIVNPPQSGILGMHAIQDRPIAKNGAVVVAPMMYVALTYDHRIIDGREAVSFLVRIKECVENPARILLEV